MNHHRLHVLFAAALACLVWFGAAGEALAMPALAVAQQATPEAAEYKALMQARQALQVNLAGLEVQYESLAKSIDSLKRKGVNTLNRSEIQSLLRKGRKLALKLAQVQRDIRRVDAKLNQSSAKMMRALDVQIAQVEAQLVKSSGAQRAKHVAHLNRLSKRRGLYAQPRPQVDHKKIDDMLSTAEGLDNPDDMIAMADELQDAEADARRKLAWMDGRLKTLKAQHRLSKRALAFSRQERFFEENTRARQVGRTQEARPTVAASDDSANDAPASPDAAPVDTADGDFESFGAGSPERGATPPETDEAPMDPVAQPTTDVFDTPETLIVSKEADPEVLSGDNAPVQSKGLGAQIKRMERDRAALKRRTEALKRKAQALRSEASTLE